MASWFNCKGIAKQGLYLVVVLVVERGGVALRWVLAALILRLVLWSGRNSLCICHTPMVRILLRVGLVHVERRWRHVLIAHVFGHATSLRVSVICAHVHCGADQK